MAAKQRIGSTAPDGSQYATITDGAGNLAGTGAVDASGNTIVVGNVAENATDSGNPVKVGAVYNSSLPTYTAGQRGNLQVNNKGELRSFLTVPTSAGADGVSNAAIGFMRQTASDSTSVQMSVMPWVFNGTTWDRVRNNQDMGTQINAVGTTTSQTGGDNVNYNSRGVKVVLDMTNVGTGSVTLNIQGKDASSSKYYTMLSGAPVTTNSTNVYEVYPGVTATANVSASSALPRVWRVTTTANNANATTYTVGASVIV